MSEGISVGGVFFEVGLAPNAAQTLQAQAASVAQSLRLSAPIKLEVNAAGARAAGEAGQTVARSFEQAQAAALKLALYQNTLRDNSQKAARQLEGSALKQIQYQEQLRAAEERRVAAAQQAALAQQQYLNSLKTGSANVQIAEFAAGAQSIRNLYQANEIGAAQAKAQLTALKTAALEYGNAAKQAGTITTQQFKNITGAAASAQRSIDQIEGNITKLGLASQVKLGVSQAVTQSLFSYNQNLGFAAQSLATLGVAGTGAALGVGLVGAAVARNVALTAEFENRINSASIVLEASVQQTAQLTALAKNIGNDLKVSAVDVASAFEQLGTFGASLDDLLRGAGEGAVLLAKATKTDLAGAAQIFGQVSQVFAGTGTEFSSVSDIIVNAANKSALTVRDFNDAIGQGGRAIGQAKLPLADFAALVATIRPQASGVGDAATALSNAVKALYAPTQQAQKGLDALKISVYNTDGSTRRFVDVLADFERALGPLTEKQRNFYLQTILGGDGLKAFNPLLQAGAAGVDKLSKSFEQSGAALEQANRQNNNLKGSLDRLKAAIDNAFISDPSRNPITLFFTQATKSLAEFVEKANKGVSIPVIIFRPKQAQTEAAVVEANRFTADSKVQLSSLQLGTLVGLIKQRDELQKFIANQGAALSYNIDKGNKAGVDSIQREINEAQKRLAETLSNLEDTKKKLAAAGKIDTPKPDKPAPPPKPVDTSDADYQKLLKLNRELNAAEETYLKTSSKGNADRIEGIRGQIKAVTDLGEKQKGYDSLIQGSLRKEQQARDEADRKREQKNRENQSKAEQQARTGREFNDRLSDTNSSFRTGLKDGKVSGSDIERFRGEVQRLERDAKQAGVTLSSSILGQSSALVQQAEKLEKSNALSKQSAEIQKLNQAAVKASNEALARQNAEIDKIRGSLKGLNDEQLVSLSVNVGNKISAALASGNTALAGKLQKLLQDILDARDLTDKAVQQIQDDLGGQSAQDFRAGERNPPTGGTNPGFAEGSKEVAALKDQFTSTSIAIDKLLEDTNKLFSEGIQPDIPTLETYKKRFEELGITGQDAYKKIAKAIQDFYLPLAKSTDPSRFLDISPANADFLRPLQEARKTLTDAFDDFGRGKLFSPGDLSTLESAITLLAKYGVDVSDLEASLNQIRVQVIGINALTGTDPSRFLGADPKTIEEAAQAYRALKAAQLDLGTDPSRFLPDIGDVAGSVQRELDLTKKEFEAGVASQQDYQAALERSIGFFDNQLAALSDRGSDKARELIILIQKLKGELGGLQGAQLVGTDPSRFGEDQARKNVEEAKTALKPLEEQGKVIFDYGVQAGNAVASAIIAGFQGGSTDAAKVLLQAGGNIAKQIGDALIAEQSAKFASSFAGNIGQGLGGALSAGLGALNPFSLILGIGLPLLGGLFGNLFGPKQPSAEELRAQQRQDTGSKTVSTLVFNFYDGPNTYNFAGGLSDPLAKASLLELTDRRTDQKIRAALRLVGFILPTS